MFYIFALVEILVRSKSLTALVTTDAKEECLLMCGSTLLQSEGRTLQYRIRM